MITYFERLYTAVPEIVEAEAPVSISEIALIKDTVDNEILLRITLANGSEESVKAVAVDIKAWDVFGDPVLFDGNDTKTYVYQDISFQPMTLYGNTVPIAMPESVRKVEAVITRAVFDNGSVWKSNPVNFVHVQKQDLLEGTDEFIGGLATEGEKYPPFLAYTENSECWQCTCGAVNRIATISCHRCGRSQEDCKKEYSAEAIHAKYIIYKEEADRREEERRIKEEAKREEERRRWQEKQRQLAMKKQKEDEERAKWQEEQDKLAFAIKERDEKKRGRLIVGLGIAVIAVIMIPVIVFFNSVNDSPEEDKSDSDSSKKTTRASETEEISTYIASAPGIEGGDVTIKAVIGSSGKIYQLTIETPDETPGIGAEVGENSSFVDQFVGKIGPFNFGENGIEAVSGATVTSTAALDALNSYYTSKETEKKVQSSSPSSSTRKSSGSSSKTYSGSSSSSSSSSGYGYDANDPYYSAADHDGDGKLTDDEFQEAMGNAIDDLLAGTYQGG